jgi:hypothetical protein
MRESYAFRQLQYEIQKEANKKEKSLLPPISHSEDELVDRQKVEKDYF